MKILLLSDTHCKHDSIEFTESELSADVIIHCGDHSNTGSTEEYNGFIVWFCSLPFKHKIFIAGNHDTYAQTYLRNYFLPLDVHYLNENEVIIESVKFYGMPLCPWQGFPPYPFGFCHERGGEVLKIAVGLIPEDTDVLITHGPPLGIMDNEEQRFGCELLRDRVFQVEPKFHVFGHIHESAGFYSDPRFKTEFHNVAQRIHEIEI